MRLILLTLDFPPSIGGVQQYLFEMARGLGLRHEVTVLTTTPGPLPSGLSFQRQVLPSAHPLTLARAVRSMRPACVLVGHAHPRLLLAAALAAPGRYAAFAYGNDYLAAQMYWHRPLFNRLLAAAHPLITISQAGAERLQSLGLPRPAVIYPGTDPAIFMPQPGAPAGPPVLLSVGRLVPRKGIDTVLQALPRLLAEFPDLCYRVAGDGPDRPRLEQMSRQLGVAHAVTFLGRVSQDDLPQVYRAAHIFVLPAREEIASVEGFGIVFLEASASGLPVVAARSGGAVEAVRHGETGLLVPPGDPDELCQALRTLIREPELRRRLGQAGRQRVEEEMSWTRAVQQLEDCLTW